MYLASTGARRDSRGDRMNYGVLHVAIAHMNTRHWLTTGTIQLKPSAKGYFGSIALLYTYI